ncbi:MAG: hypothetical protein ACLRXQ_04260 [Phascolarctobacterium faecium]
MRTGTEHGLTIDRLHRVCPSFGQWVKTTLEIAKMRGTYGRKSLIPSARKKQIYGFAYTFANFR